jgi:hypothetical protein
MTSPMKRTDLLPYYGRFVATISQYSPDLGKDLIAEVCLPLYLQSPSILTRVARIGVPLSQPEEEGRQGAGRLAGQGTASPSLTNFG